MLSMLDRMTIGTQNHKIGKSIIMSIFINMVNPYYFFAFIKSANLALIKHSSAQHIFSHSAKNTFPIRFITFIYTGFTTIFSLPRGGIIKCFITESAFMRYFGIVRSFFSCYFNKSRWFSGIFSYMPKTSLRAANRFFGSIRCYFISFFAMFTD